MMQVWLYHYYFDGVAKPVIIQALNKQQARSLLVTPVNGKTNIPDGKTVNDIVQESVSQAVTGISERFVNGKKYLWAGIGHGDNGWVKAEDYKPG